MRFMMLMIPKGYATAAPTAMPDAEGVAKMMVFNTKLQQSGNLIALDGLHPPAAGVRISFAGGKSTATDGPFTEAKEVLGGYWTIKAASKEEAVKWALQIPANDGDIVEVRQVQEFEDFPKDVQKEVAEFKADFEKKA
ncbi:MAG: YciI family protein [Gemmatimonadaceae bacterium]